MNLIPILSDWQRQIGVAIWRGSRVAKKNTVRYRTLAGAMRVPEPCGAELSIGRTVSRCRAFRAGRDLVVAKSDNEVTAIVSILRKGQGICPAFPASMMQWVGVDVGRQSTLAYAVVPTVVGLIR
jgi:hypothetical protein